MPRTDREIFEPLSWESPAYEAFVVGVTLAVGLTVGGWVWGFVFSTSAGGMALDVRQRLKRRREPPTAPPPTPD